MKSPRAGTLTRAERDAQEWLDHVAREMGEDHRPRAYSAFRAVMHALRDCLSYEDVLAVGAALPPILRGALLEGWHPAGGERIARTQEAFLARVAESLLGVARMPPQRAARAVFGVLQRRADRALPSIEALRPSSSDAPAPPKSAEEAAQDIRTALERAQSEGVPIEELPELRTGPERRRGSRPGRPGQSDILQTSLQKTHAWVRELDAALRLGDPDFAFSALCAALRALRDRLSRDEAFHLASQLPMTLVGFLFDAPPDAAALKERSRGEFLARVSRNMADRPDFRPEEAVRAVFALLARHVTEGELEDVRDRLPAPVRALWPPERARSRQHTLGGRATPRGGGRARRGTRARARRAKREVRSVLARARARGVPEQDLPTLAPRRRGR